MTAVTYHSPRLSIDVSYDEREKYLGTSAIATIDSHTMYAGLSCLYVEAGLGPAQHIPQTARTWHEISNRLSAQAAATKKFLPHLLGPHRDDLLRACHAR